MRTISDASFQPYAFLLAGRRRTSSGASIPDDNSNGFHTPPQGPQDSPRSSAPELASEHAKYLGGHLEFVVPPRINPVENAELPTSSHCLFLGHLKFETSPADVRWLLKRLCGVTVLRAEFRGNGCCVVYLASENDEMAVRSLNRRVLFDHNGVWFARTAAAVDILLDYVEKVLPRLCGKYGRHRPCLRLPRDSLVVEDSRSGKKSNRRTSHADSDTSSMVRRAPAPLSASSMSPRDCRMYGGSPPTPYSLGSPSLLGGFHVAPPDYALPADSTTSSLNSLSGAPPPYYAC
jgi:hypothetical protein